MPQAGACFNSDGIPLFPEAECLRTPRARVALDAPLHRAQGPASCSLHHHHTHALASTAQTGKVCRTASRSQRLDSTISRVSTAMWGIWAETRLTMMNACSPG